MPLLRNVNRRDLLVGAAILAASTVPQELHAQTPRRGGRLRVGIAGGATSDTIDPAIMDSAFTIPMAYTAFNHLTETDSSGRLVPELAEEWEAVGTPDEWTFRLRRGIQFHNGKTMAAEDVVASLNYHRGENSKSVAKPFLDAVEDINTDGTDRVRIKLKSPNVDLPAIISDYHFVIMPSQDGRVSPLAGIGTGPYALKQLDPGIGAVWTRHPNYFKTDRAFFDEIEFRSILDDAARNNALVTGEVDVVDRVPLQVAERMRKISGIRLEETVGTEHLTLPMRADTPPFTDRNVRLALKHAIDRDEFVRKIMFGYATPGNDNPISSAYRYFDPGLEKRQYDPEKARWHLKQAGLNELKVDLSVSQTPFAGAVEAGLLAHESAKAAGIEITLVQEVDDGYWANVWMKRPWCACSWVGPALEDWIFTNAYAADAPWNDTFWKNDRFNSLLGQSRAESEEGKRREIYAEMQRIVRDDGGVIVLSYNKYLIAMRDNVQHGQLASNWKLDGYKFSERWWFA